MMFPQTKACKYAVQCTIGEDVKGDPDKAEIPLEMIWPTMSWSCSKEVLHKSTVLGKFGHL